MSMRHFLKIVVCVSAVSSAVPAAADPVDPAGRADLSAVRIVLASLHKDLEVPRLPNLSPRISSPEFVQETEPVGDPLIQLAGRCGSSNKYCNSPGFTYCCGNSSDGYYCAANVNGCTK